MLTQQIEGHAGQQAIAAMLAFGTDIDVHAERRSRLAAVRGGAQLGMRVVDTRHEQTATFAAEAYAKFTRRPGLAVLTAGPGITNGVSAITTAPFNGSPLVVLGGRAPELRWGSGSLQEMDHVPVVASITKSAATVEGPGHRRRRGPRRGRLTVPPPPRTDVPRLPARRVFGPSAGELPAVDAPSAAARRPTRTSVAALAERRSATPSGRRSSSAATSTGTGRGTRCAPPSSTCACRASSTGSAAARSRRPRARLPAHPRPAEGRRRSRRRARHPARLPARASGSSARRRSPMSSTARPQRARHVDVHTVAGDIRADAADAGRCSSSGATTSDWIAELRAAESPGAQRTRRCSASDDNPIRAEPDLRRARPGGWRATRW